MLSKNLLLLTFQMENRLSPWCHYRYIDGYRWIRDAESSIKVRDTDSLDVVRIVG